MKKKNKQQVDQINLSDSEEVRLELLNLAVLFRSEMIGKEEFQSKARSMGFQESPEFILEQVPALNLG